MKKKNNKKLRIPLNKLCCKVVIIPLSVSQQIITVFALTQLPKTWNKQNWIRTSENYERICLNK